MRSLPPAPTSPHGGPRRGRVLVIHPSQSALGPAVPALGPLAEHLSHREELGELPPDEALDLLVVDYDGLALEGRQRLREAFSGLRRRTPLVLVSQHRCHEELPLLLGSHTLTNLVAHDGVVNAEELALTARKLLSGDIFGIEPYLPGLERRARIEVTRSLQKAEVLDWVACFAGELEVHPRVALLMRGIADELFTNALYNAPVDTEGRPRFRHLARTSSVSLEPDRPVEMELGAGGGRLVVSVVDRFGSLTPQRLLDYLARCLRGGEDQVERKQGGAGLGLYHLFQSVTQLVVNLQPSRRTEVLGILDTGRSYRALAGRARSFHVFLEGPSRRDKPVEGREHG